MRCLSSGSSSARTSMPSVAADGLGGARLSPVSMTASTPSSLQRRDARPSRRRAARRAWRSGRRPRPPTSRTETVLPSSLKAAIRAVSSSSSVPLCSAAACGEPRKSSIAADACRRRPCRRRACIGGVRHRCDAVAFGPGQDGDGERMARARLERGRQRAGPRCSSARRRPTMSVTFGLPSVSVPVLSKATRLTLPSVFQHRAALHQQPAARAGRQAPRRWPPASR